MLGKLDGLRLLFDYGLKPEEPPQYPLPPDGVDHLFLTHCHLDHSGMVPFVTARHSATVHCTPVTYLLSEILAEDSLKIARERGYPEPYDRRAIISMRSSHSEVGFKDTIDFPSFEVLTHSAGHIPGATMWEINSHDRTVFTGDMHTLSTNLVGGARPVPCDNLVIESTYAGREHPERKKLEWEFLGRIEEVLDRGGKVIVPAFAIGRTQEILMVLARGHFDIWLDGMGKEVIRTYLRYPEYLKDPKKLRRALKPVTFVKSPDDRKKALKRADVIVTTSGMLNGGPVEEYLEATRKDARNAVFLTGYQVKGTNARMIVEQQMVEFKGEKRKVESEVDSFDFSAHAGHSELLKFIRESDPQKVVLMHGDNREALAKEMDGEREVILPKPDVEFEL
jgi:putative mRNA 3-end processing factor